MVFEIIRSVIRWHFIDYVVMTKRQRHWRIKAQQYGDVGSLIIEFQKQVTEAARAEGFYMTRQEKTLRA